MPKSSTPGLLLMIVSRVVPLARRAWIRFSGMPQRPKPPMRIEAPSGMSATAASALGRTLFMASALQPFAPASGSDEDLLEPVARRQILSQVAEQLDQRIERDTDRIGVGGGDVLPDVGGTRRQARGVHEASSGQSETLVAHPVADNLHQRAGRELRQMTEKRHQAIVRLGGGH